jgi:putative membrane protein
LKRKSIPLDRITDVVLVQGPFMRMARIWSLQIQTAGSNQQGPKGALQGIVDAKVVRDNIMNARDAAASGQAKT